MSFLKYYINICRLLASWMQLKCLLQKKGKNKSVVYIAILLGQATNRKQHKKFKLFFSPKHCDIRIDTITSRCQNTVVWNWIRATELSIKPLPRREHTDSVITIQRIEITCLKSSLKLAMYMYICMLLASIS